MVEKWEKPKLIVLVRGRPEEAILQGCKTDGVGGPNYAYTGCAVSDDDLCMSNCSSFGGS